MYNRCNFTNVIHTTTQTLWNEKITKEIKDRECHATLNFKRGLSKRHRGHESPTMNFGQHEALSVCALLPVNCVVILKWQETLSVDKKSHCSASNCPSGRLAYLKNDTFVQDVPPLTSSPDNSF